MKEILLTNGGVTLVSDCDYEALCQWSWHLSSTGYVLRNIDLKKIHRFIMKARIWDVIDHIDRNKLNNSRENLRKVSVAENIHNQGKRKNTKNNYKGTTFKKELNGWEARCRMYGQDFYLGVYKSEKAAGYAYNKKALELNPNCWVNEFTESIEELENLLKRDLLRSKIAKKVSKYPNIYWIEKKGRCKFDKWAVIFRIDGKNKYFGRYLDEEEAYQRVLEVIEEFGYSVSKKLNKITN